LIVCAFVVLAMVIAVWWVVDFRSAPPSPPQVTMPR
jgi:hypothetical protein